MTTMAFGRGVRHGPSLRFGAVGGIAGALALLLVLAALAGRSSGPRRSPLIELADRQAAVESWEAAVHPLIESGGQVVALGPRKAIGQLQQGTITPTAVEDMATGWVRRLSELQRQLAAVATPVSLRRAHELLGSAMAGYVQASRGVLAAASETGARRAELLTAAAAAGTAADKTYDDATAAIASLRAALSLPTDWSAS
jgi:HPt (histidine-containing phosphotransfer) domain-containing protein